MPQGDYDYLAYQTDNVYVLSVRPLSNQEVEEQNGHHHDGGRVHFRQEAWSLFAHFVLQTWNRASAIQPNALIAALCMT